MIGTQLKFELSGDMIDQLAQWYEYQSRLLPILGVGWIAIVIQVQGWIVGGSSLHEEILTDPRSGTQFRFVGNKYGSDRSLVRIELITCIQCMS